MTRSRPPRKVIYFEPVPPRLARNTIIESTFEVGRRFRCTMRVDCGELDPGAVIRASTHGLRRDLPCNALKDLVRFTWEVALNCRISANLRCRCRHRLSLTPSRRKRTWPNTI
jgi:hypothetical protein